MSEPIEYLLNTASEAEIGLHLRTCESRFVPPLSTRIEIDGYAEKITGKAMRFEAWADGHLVGLVAAYLNDRESRIAYITSVSVLSEWVGKGIAGRLMAQCVQHARESNFRQIRLEVWGDNAPAIKLYRKNGFVADEGNASLVMMSLQLESGE